MLADLATHRLERDHGIDPTEHPDEARQLLGDDAWRRAHRRPGGLGSRGRAGSDGDRSDSLDWLARRDDGHAARAVGRGELARRSRRARAGRPGRRRQGRGAASRAGRDPRPRARPAGGRAGRRQDAHRPLVRPGARPRLPPGAVHARPAAVGRHRFVRVRPAHERVRVPGRAGLHRAAARRRDQPHPTEDAGGPARGDAGAPGHGRGHDVPAGRAVPRRGHRQPGRVRGHLPAARGAARPLPAPRAVRLPVRGRGVGRPRPAHRPPPGGAGRRRGDRRRGPARPAAGVRDRHRRPVGRALLRRARRGDAPPPPGADRRVAARLARPAADGAGARR